MVYDVCIYMSLICVWLINKVIDFKFPDKGELERISNKERLNIFRRYFAASRYNRLLIQKNLIKSAYNESSPSEILELERSHNQDFFDKVRVVKEYGILDEFIDAAKEEEYGLQKIIEAYDKRIMNESLS
jgi:predicted RND superfamily exporter protein